LDQTLHKYPERISLYGSEPDGLRLMSFVGALVQLEEITTHKRHNRTLIGRVNSVGGFKAEEDHVGKIADVTVTKSTEVFDRDQDEQRHCSYTYSVDVKGWPVEGMFGLSYDGSISLRRYDGGLHLLLENDDFSLKATPHFFFHDDERKLVRQRLASVHLTWSGEELDSQRLLDCARIVLAFIYAVKLRPLAKTHVASGIYRVVSWSPSDLETVDRGTYFGPLPIGEQQVFQATAIKTLFSSDYGVEFLSGIADRYVEVRTEISLERSFPQGCEAIEALYALLQSRVSGVAMPKYSRLRKELKKLVEERVENEADRKIAVSKVDQLFNRPTWQRVCSLIRGLATDETSLIHEVISRSKFFQYRNLSSHGQVVRPDNELVFQANLMRYVIEWLFIRLCGGTAEPQIASQVRHELNQTEPPDLGIIQLWE
jgi:hypothetical protein